MVRGLPRTVRGRSELLAACEIAKAAAALPNVPIQPYNPASAGTARTSSVLAPQQPVAGAGRSRKPVLAFLKLQADADDGLFAKPGGATPTALHKRLDSPDRPAARKARWHGSLLSCAHDPRAG